MITKSLDEAGDPAVTQTVKDPTKTWTVICRTVAVAATSLFVLFSVLTYYDSLSQYNSADEKGTLNRINTFLADHDRVQISVGSNVSNVAVGFPGSYMRSWLDAHFKIDDRILGNIYYTNVLPFAFVQVTIALLLLFVCTLIVGKLSRWRIRTDYFYYLLCFSIILNLPMVKGLCKVLKYDCLSILLSATALLSYILAKRRRSFWLLLLAVALGALAYAEKDTTISVIFFIATSEILFAFFEVDSLRRLPLRLGLLCLTIPAVFLITFWAIIPRLWANPGELSFVFSSIGGYGVSVDLKVVFLSAATLALFWVARNRVVEWASKIRQYFSPKWAFAILALFLLYAVLYQKNDIKWNMDRAGIQLAEHDFWVGPQVDRFALTTLDKGPLLTKTKYILSEGRLLIYFLPEAAVIALLASPLLLGRVAYTVDKRAASLIIGFCLLHVIAYAHLLVPIEAKYLSLVLFSLVVLAASILAGTTKQLDAKNSLYGSVAGLVIVGCLIPAACLNRPAHFGYMNVFRSRSAEDIASINVEDYSFWTWVGWGETSYSLVNFAAKHSQGKNIAIGWDYEQPLHHPSNVTMVKTQETWQLGDRTKLDEYLTTLAEERKLDYIIISKNTANRDLALNQLLKQKRDRAVYVDKQGGIEYGWLFRPGALVNR